MRGMIVFYFCAVVFEGDIITGAAVPSCDCIMPPACCCGAALQPWVALVGHLCSIAAESSHDRTIVLLRNCQCVAVMVRCCASRPRIFLSACNADVVLPSLCMYVDVMSYVLNVVIFCICPTPGLLRLCYLQLHTSGYACVIRIEYPCCAVR